MSEHGEQQEQQGPGDAAARTPPRRPLPAKIIFDDPLDQPASDDTDTGWGGNAAGSGSAGGRDLDWYLNEKPPHHGG